MSVSEQEVMLCCECVQSPDMPFVLVCVFLCVGGGTTILISTENVAIPVSDAAEASQQITKAL